MTSRLAVLSARPAKVGSTQHRRSITCATEAESDSLWMLVYTVFYWCIVTSHSRILMMLFHSVLWHCWYGHLACKNRPRNDLLCIVWDVKPTSTTTTLWNPTKKSAWVPTSTGRMHVWVYLGDKRCRGVIGLIWRQYRASMWLKPYSLKQCSSAHNHHQSCQCITFAKPSRSCLLFFLYTIAILRIF